MATQPPTQNRFKKRKPNHSDGHEGALPQPAQEVRGSLQGGAERGERGKSARVGPPVRWTFQKARLRRPSVLALLPRAGRGVGEAGQGTGGFWGSFQKARRGSGKGKSAHPEDWSFMGRCWRAEGGEEAFGPDGWGCPRPHS